MATAGEKKEENVTSTGRQRKLTEKGQAYAIEEAEKKYNKAIRLTKKAASELEKKFESHDEVEEGEKGNVLELISARRDLEDTFITVLEIRDLLLDLHTEEGERERIDGAIAELDIQVKGLIERTKTLLDATQGTDPGLEKKKSTKSKSVRTKSHSARSRGASGSAASATSSKVKLKLAEVEARYKLLKLEEQFLGELLSMEAHQKKVKARQEVQKSELELKIMKQYLEDPNDGCQSQRSEVDEPPEECQNVKAERWDELNDENPTVNRQTKSQTQPAHQVKKEAQHPTTTSYKVSTAQQEWPRSDPMPNPRPRNPPSVNSVNSLDSTTNDLILELLRQQAAPEITMEKFSGDPLLYRQFITSFIQNVETKIPDELGRLKRLIQYTEGAPHAMISSLIYDANRGYERAIDLLQSEFGSLYAITAAYDREVENWRKIPPNEGKSILDFYIFLLKIKNSLDSTEFRSELDTQENLRKLARKLPSFIQDRWNRRATTIKIDHERKVHFGDFVKFVKTESDVTNNPSFSRDIMRGHDDRKFHDQRGTYKYKSAAMKGNFVERSCVYCGKPHHDIDSCRNFERLELSERQAFIGKERRCFACYDFISPTHNARSCKKAYNCRICKKRHPTLLHDESRRPRRSSYESPREPKESKDPKDGEESPDQDSQNPKVKKGCATKFGIERVLLNCVVANIRSSNSGKMVKAYCFLDSLSNCSFINEDVLRTLENVSSNVATERLSIATLVGNTEVDTKSVNGLKVESLDGSASLTLPEVFSRDRLPLDGQDIVGHEFLKQWPYLHHLTSVIPDYDRTIPIGLIIGNDVPRALEPLDCIKGFGNGPYATLTALGWTVAGPAGKVSGKSQVNCNATNVKPIAVSENGETLIIPESEDKDGELCKTLEAMYKTDFIEHSLHQQSKSQEDFVFLELMENQTKLVDGHQELPLPIRDENNVQMPDNFHPAYRRAVGLRNRLLKPENCVLLEKYAEFMNKLVNNGHASIVPCDKVDKPGKSWFLVYHDVKHPQKPDKFRIVFNCSKQFEGVSLNDVLMSGPTSDLTNSLIGVFLRFRQEEFAFMGDIEGMFHQTRVPKDQRSFLKFLWWDNDQLNGEPVTFELSVHLFGASSSPSCANFALRKTALDNSSQFSEESVSTVMNNFYVDDLLKSVDNVESGARLIKEVKELCQLGGFKLTKFVASNPEVLKLVHEEDIVKSSASGAVDLSENSSENFTETPTIERALGVEWDIGNDSLGFRIKFKDRPATRKGLLSAISSVWDIFGLCAPFLLPGKRVLQKLARSEFRWDDILPPETMRKWNQWIESLHLLQKIKVRRCFKPPQFGPVKEHQIHVFSDASDDGYGAAIYTRLVNEKDEISINLAFGKSRVIPLDGESIPRSELVAASLAAEFSSVVKNQLDYENVKVYLWTDSMVVLGYLKNARKKFKSFVMNRVRKILKYSDLTMWKHVPSDENPADDASRGLNAQRVNSGHRWFTGPQFLSRPESTWQMKSTSEIADVDDKDPELRKDQVSFATKSKAETTKPEPDTDDDVVLKIISRDSDWYHMRHRIASLMFMIQNPKKPVNVTVELLREAELKIVSHVQKSQFGAEIERLKSKQCIAQSSLIANLDPILDEAGILRVGGRLDKSNFDENLKHPIILPKFSHVTDVILEHCHAKVAHGGRNATLNQLRTDGFWILHANSKIRFMLRKCFRCKQSRGKFGQQKMASLPSDRTENVAPFTHVSVDLFGPYLVKDGRKSLKRYGVIFCDLVYRGVHIETTTSLSTDTFILALRRFIGRRGPIQLLRCDNGSNFVGAKNELEKAVLEMDTDLINTFLLKQNCKFEWKFNTPAASHHGGVWERVIRSIRQRLDCILKLNPSQLTDESLRTFLVEVEGIVNSRPLTVETLSDHESPLPLSPMNLITQKSKIVLPPPGQFDECKMTRKHWRRVQHFANQFWSRFRKEYLTILQQRNKWQKPERNFCIGDIVLLKDDSVCRNDWPLAIIEQVFPDQTTKLVRSVKLRISRCNLREKVKFLERPVSKIVLLLEAHANADVATDENES